MRHHMTVDGVIPFTDAEETAKDLEEKEWADGEVVRNAMAEIQRLEAQITIRRLREAYKDSTWVDAQDELIKKQRDKL